MTSPKSQSRLPGWAGPLRRLFSLLFGRGRALTLGLLLVGACALGWHLVWRQVGPRVLSSPEYVLRPQGIEITPPPEWIHTDIRAEVFRGLSLDGPLSILDENLAEKIASGFSLHPWVAKVRRVTKHHPARVTVELEYRRPVLMVEVAGGLFPVDARGILLPAADFSPLEKNRYPRLVGAETVPLGTVGEYWGDARVVGAAEIAAALGPLWQELRLAYIVSAPAAGPGPTDDYLYSLYTREGSRVIWGRPPGSNAQGELPPAEKVARLKQYAAANGGLEGQAQPKEVDLRTGKASAE